MIQVMSGSGESSIPTTFTSYAPFLGGITSFSPTMYRQLDIVGKACAVRNVYLRISSPPGVGKSWTFTVYSGLSSTGIVITIADLDTSGTYNGPDLDLSYHSAVTLQAIPNGGPASTGLSAFSYEIETAGDTQCLLFGSTGGFNSVSPRYSGVLNHLGAGARAADGGPDSIWNVVPIDGTIEGFHLYVARGLPNSCEPFPCETCADRPGILEGSWTLYKSTDNGGSFSSQFLFTRACPNPLLQQNVHAITGLSIPVSRGDIVFMQADISFAGFAQWSGASCISFISSEAHKWPICGQSNGTASNSATRYVPLFDPRPVTYSSSESGVVSTAGRSPVSLGNMIVVLSTPPGSGNSRQFTTRVNGADTALQCTIADGDVVGENVIDAAPTVDGDEFCLQLIPTSSPALSRVIWAYTQDTSDVVSGGESEIPGDLPQVGVIGPYMVHHWPREIP